MANQPVVGMGGATKPNVMGSTFDLIGALHLKHEWPADRIAAHLNRTVDGVGGWLRDIHRPDEVGNWDAAAVEAVLASRTVADDVAIVAECPAALDRVLPRVEATEGRLRRFEAFAAKYRDIMGRTFYANPDAHPGEQELFRLYQEAMKP